MDTNFWFFSYAHSDDGPYLRKFYEDLDLEIRFQTALPRAQIGFMDRNQIAHGAAWDSVLEESLRTCRVFVPLYSTSYFQSEYCGKEFAVFRERLHNYQRQHALPVEDTLILPVLWNSEDRILQTTGLLNNISYTDEAYPKEYTREGVLRMVKRHAIYEGAYEKLLQKLAMKIIDLAKRIVLPPLATPLPPLANVKSIFSTLPLPSFSVVGQHIIQNPGNLGPATRDTSSGIDRKELADSSPPSQLTGPNDSTKQDQLLIFICYRREDSADITGRIYDSLVQRFGRRAIFKDVDSIPLGVDFKRYLEKRVEQCNVLLAVIGKSWLKKKAGKRRVDNPSDFVRIEIASALRRDIPVIPLMVSNAHMPIEADLPEDLHGLVFRNSLPIRSDPDFHNDMSRLIRELEQPPAL